MKKQSQAGYTEEGLGMLEERKKKKEKHVLFLQREGDWMKQIPKWKTGVGNTV